MNQTEEALPYIVDSLLNALEQEQKAHLETLLSVSKARALNQLQENEFSSRITALGLLSEDLSQKKDREIEQKRLQHAAELAQLHEDFAGLAKSTHAGKRKSGAVQISDRLFSISITLNERNEIISSLEDALERLSEDRMRIRRERDYLKRHVEILEVNCFMEDSGAERLKGLIDVTSAAGSNLKSPEDFRSWIDGNLKNSPTQEPSLCVSNVYKSSSNDCEVQANYFGCESFNVPPATDTPHEKDFISESGGLKEPAKLEREPDMINEESAIHTQSHYEVAEAADGKKMKLCGCGKEHRKETEMDEQDGKMSRTEQRQSGNCERQGESAERQETAGYSRETESSSGSDKTQSRTKDVSQSGEIKMLKLALDEMGKAKVSSHSKNAKQTVEWMVKELSELKAQNEGHEIRRSILERNRDMLEESVGQLEKELDGYRTRERKVRSEKKDKV